MRRTTQWALLAGLILPTLATAASITITDLTDGNPIVTMSGFDPSSINTQFAAEGFDMHGEFSSTCTTCLANGQSITVNFNFLEPLGEPGVVAGQISDTLSIVFTGHVPQAGDVNNVSMDLHFRSDSDPAGVTALVNAHSITETGGIQSLASQILQDTNLPDFQATVQSDVVPEPGSWGMMLIGGVGMLLGAWWRSRSAGE